MPSYRNSQTHEEDARGASSSTYTETYMATRLTEADRHAVDALLDAAAPAAENQPADARFQQRLTAARGWLNLIATLPAEEPSTNLVAATLARIERVSAAATQTEPQPAVQRL